VNAAVRVARPTRGRLEITVRARPGRVLGVVASAVTLVVGVEVAAPALALGVVPAAGAVWPAAALGALAAAWAAVALLSEERCVIDLGASTYAVTDRTPFGGRARGGPLTDIARVRAADRGGDRHVAIDVTTARGPLRFPRRAAGLSARDHRRVVDAIARFASGVSPPPRRWGRGAARGGRRA
jgi:hypothetical protein